MVAQNAQNAQENPQNPQVEEARQLRLLGVPDTKIADKLGVHRNTILGWLGARRDDEGVDLPPNRFESGKESA